MTDKDSKQPAAVGRETGLQATAATWGRTLTVAALGVAIGASLLVGLAALGLVDLGGPRGDGNDPVVVDNPQIDLYRKDQAKHPKPAAFGSDGKWTLHPMKMFTRIEVTSWEKLAEGEEKEKYYVAGGSFAGGDVEFYGTDKQLLFTVHRENVAGYWGPVAVPATGTTFKEHGNEMKKMVANGKNHIAQIRFSQGTSYICVGDGPQPTYKECADGTKRPKKLKVEICSESGCVVSQ
jgi:hypothetical protein